MAIQALAAVEGIGARYAEKLVLAGFLTLEGLLAADAEDLTAIEGISEDAAKKLQAAAEAAFEKEHGPIEE